MRVAALDDEPEQLELIRQTLASMGHDCHVFDESKALIRALRRESFDLVLLDWQIPEISGIEVLQWLRSSLKERVPIMFVTNRTSESDLMRALAAGADDYMLKPLRLGELRARVHALTRRAYPSMTSEEMQCGRYRLDVAKSGIELDGEVIPMKHKEFDLALFLFRNVGRLLSRRHLTEAVWGIEGDVHNRSLDTHISRLRTKLKLHPENGFRLYAVYSVGYRLEVVSAPQAAVEASSSPSAAHAVK